MLVYMRLEESAAGHLIGEIDLDDPVETLTTIAAQLARKTVFDGNAYRDSFETQIVCGDDGAYAEIVWMA
jgi:hypothetical protein